jgi:hypothetical protein
MEFLSGESRNVDPETVEDWNYSKKLKVMTSVTYNADETVYNPAKPPHFEETFAMVVQNLNSGLLCSSHAMKMVVIHCHSSNRKNQETACKI